MRTFLGCEATVRPAPEQMGGPVAVLLHLRMAAPDDRREAEVYLTGTDKVALAGLLSPGELPSETERIVRELVDTLEMDDLHSCSRSYVIGELRRALKART